MPMVAMTREMGSLGKDVAAGVAARMNRKVAYDEIIEPIASKMRLRKSHVERFLDGKAGLWERLTTDKTSLSIFTADESFRFLRDGSTGVVRGWGVVPLFRDAPNVVRVRVCAPLELRIERMMERLGTQDRDAVAKEIEMSDEANTAINRRLFGIDWRDAEHYHIVLNTEHLGVDQCVQALHEVVSAKQFADTPDATRVIENLALKWSVRAALRRDPRTAKVDVQIECQDGQVTMNGVVDAGRDAEAAREVVAKVEGVKRVETKLHSMSGEGARRFADG